MAERQILHVAFRYRVPLEENGKHATGPDGEPLYLERTAFRGETVDIPLAEDVERGDKFGAFGNPADDLALSAPPAPVSTVTLDDLAGYTAQEIAAFIETEKPTVAQLTDAVGDNPDLARVVLDAETQAFGGTPRVSLKAALEKIADSGGEA